jgi:hypothetical protein
VYTPLHLIATEVIMKINKHLVLTMLLIGFVLAPAAASAQDLLSNRHFESDLTGWTGVGWWSSEDCFSDPKTGSVTYINQTAGTAAWYIARQCVELPAADEVYLMSGYLAAPTSQTGDGWAKIGLVWYSVAACGAAGFIDGSDAPHVYPTTDAWQTTRQYAVPPPGAVSVYFAITNQKTSEQGTFQIYADEVSLIVLSKIFVDGFESGDTTAWSATVP